MQAEHNIMTVYADFFGTPSYLDLTQPSLTLPLLTPPHLRPKCTLPHCIQRYFTIALCTVLQPHLPHYGVVQKGLLTFLGSLCKEVAKTTPETLVYRFERLTTRKKKSSFKKQCVLNLESRILSQEPSDSFILYFNVIFHGK